jgi:hypothetical protein
MREAYSLVWSVLVLLFRSRVSLEAEILILVINLTSSDGTSRRDWPSVSWIA